MENLKHLIFYFKGYQHVADFQRLCGVEIATVEELTSNDNNGISNNVEKSTESNRPDHDAIKRNVNGVHKNGYKNGLHNSEGHEKKLAYKIKNKAFYFLMQFGAGLGGEIFYITFFPFLLWNIDSRLCRHILLIWYPLMYFGQFLKDMIKWPRPGPPAVRLEGNRFEMEYGMPSTHTIVGTCIPFSLLVLVSRHYEMSWGLGLFGALVWAGLVACSRVYLGMHTALDCIAGVGMTLVLLPPMLSVVEQVDFFQLTSPYAPIFLLLLPILACVYYPKPAVWSITRGDTSNIVSIGSLVCTVGWFHYQLGWMEETPHPPGLQPFPPITTDWLYYSAIRTVCGVIALAVSRVVSKKIWLKLVCNFAGVETKDTAKQREIGLEVPMRWFVIGGLAVNTAFTAPLVFHYFGINREYYYKEIGL